MKESYTERRKFKNDQALTLRMTNFAQRQHKAIGLTRVISFTSGKGGVGKTNTVVNLALCLANRGKSVLILDADLGLANVDVMLGLKAKHTLYDVLEGRRSLKEVIVPGPAGVSVIPAARGIESLCNLDLEQRLALLNSVEEIAAQYDYLLIDTRAGISSDVMHFNSAANEIVCVITNEPTSLTDAYAVIKVLAQNYAEKSISILGNNIRATERSPEQEAMASFRRLEQAVQRFLPSEQVDLKYLGFIPSESVVSESIRHQRAVVELFPSSATGRALNSLAERIDGEFPECRVKGGMQFFFRQLIEMGGYGG